MAALTLLRLAPAALGKMLLAVDFSLGESKEIVAGAPAPVIHALASRVARS